MHFWSAHMTLVLALPKHMRFCSQRAVGRGRMVCVPPKACASPPPRILLMIHYPGHSAGWFHRSSFAFQPKAGFTQRMILLRPRGQRYIKPSNFTYSDARALSFSQGPAICLAHTPSAVPMTSQHFRQNLSEVSAQQPHCGHLYIQPPTLLSGRWQ